VRHHSNLRDTFLSPPFLPGDEVVPPPGSFGGSLITGSSCRRGLRPGDFGARHTILLRKLGSNFRTRLSPTICIQSRNGETP
jgi:hypothetical protein